MARNDELAAQVRAALRQAGVVALNLVSSPGSGKTALLERTLAAVGEELGVAVVTGDVQTQNDADRLARHTDRLVQAVVTGGACHLDALQVGTAISALELDRTRLLFIENVGNLVCPASWDLGEDAKIVVFSDTEGEVCRKYGVIQEKDFEGVRRECLVRSTFVIDKKGVIRHATYGVNPRGHAAEVFDLVRRLRS